MHQVGAVFIGEWLPGASLRHRTKRPGLSQSGLAEALGVTPNTVARWERGVQRIANPERVSAAIRQLEQVQPDATLRPLAVATTLGIVDEFDIPLTDTLERAAAGHRQLLVLDNCEHVLDAAATLIMRLLRAGPLTRILTTSRESLGIDGETVWRVPPLSLPQMEMMSPDSLLNQSDAMLLLVDRAQSVHRQTIGIAPPRDVVVVASL
jgi:predicted ATPase